MNRLIAPLRLARMVLALLGPTLLVAGLAWAQTTYKIQQIARLGDRAGDILLPSGGSYQFYVGALNDSGQLLFTIQDPAGQDGSALLLQYADGKFTLIAAAEKDGPIGKWPQDLYIDGPIGMNQSGNAVFAGKRGANNNFEMVGTFLWDAKARKLTAVAIPGMPATGGLTFTSDGANSPAINNTGEIVLPSGVQGSTGLSGSGLFFLGQDQKLQPVLLTGQALPGGGKADSLLSARPSLTDRGAIAFRLYREGDGTQASAYLWEQGTLTPLLVAGTKVPGIGEISRVSGVFANNQNRDVLLSVTVTGSSGDGLYRAAGGKIVPVAVPGQEMPGGGKLQSAVPGGGAGQRSISQASEAGEHAFIAALADGTTAAYRVDVKGYLSLILKSGTPTGLGTITRIGPGPNWNGIGINSRGQVALAVQIDSGPPTLVLLTPTAL